MLKTMLPFDSKMGSGAAIVWFRSTDLRLHDNAPLTKAHLEHEHVIHVFCFDDRSVGPTATSDFSRSLPVLNWPKTGPYRSRFLLESVADLRSNLERASNGTLSANQTLLVRIGRPEHILPNLAAQFCVTSVYCSEAEAQEEIDAQRAVAAALPATCHVCSTWENTMYHIDDLPFKVPSSTFPRSATEFKNAAEKRCIIRDPLPRPTQWKSPPPSFDLGIKGDMPALDLLCPADIVPEAFRGMEAKGVLRFRGGETAALQRLEDYFFTTDSLKTYFSTRNGMLGANYSSKFSPWLATGCLSARLVNHEIERYERERVKSKETYWMRFELTFRDYFRFYCKQHGSSVFKIHGPKGNGTSNKKWVQDIALLDQWRYGNTGNPMIDANMRELYCSGFMSNRGRQIVASYLTRDMGVDWRLGAMHFESLLIDHDPCQNWGNWTYSAGVGSDPREDRYFSVTKQTSVYDPDHRYIKHWVPEVTSMTGAELTRRLSFGTKQQRDGREGHTMSEATKASPIDHSSELDGDNKEKKVVTRTIRKKNINQKRSTTAV